MNTETAHSYGIIPISLSKMLERMSYYGMRSILVLFMVNTLMFSHEQAHSAYSLFILITGLTPLIGGIIGDLALGHKLTSIIGGFIQATGYFVLAIPNEIGLYTGLILIAFGNGLYNPNTISMIGALYQKRVHKMDAAMMIFYFAINVGAFIAPLFIGVIGEHLGYQTGFILAGIILVGGQLLLIFLNNLLSEIPKTPSAYLPNVSKENKAGFRIIVMICTGIFIPLFWIFYGTTSNTSYNLIGRVTESFHSFYQVSQLINPIITILLAVILALVWSFVKMSPFLKIAIGFIIYGLSCFFISIVNQDSVSNSMALFIIVSLVLQSIAEMFISPIAWSVIFRYGPSKFRATVMSGYVCIITLLNYLTSSFLTHTDYVSSSIYYIIVSALLIIIAGIYFILYIVSRKAVIS